MNFIMNENKNRLQAQIKQQQEFIPLKNADNNTFSQRFNYYMNKLECEEKET